MGGIGGNQSRDGYVMEILYRDEYDLITGKVKKLGQPIEMVNVNLTILRNGTNGMDGQNEIGIEQPDPVKPVNLPYIINEYKYFAREKLASDPQEWRKLKIRDFYNQIDSNPDIEYDTLGFIDEFIGIEKQYFELLHKLPLEEYYASLMKRIHKKMLENPPSNDDKKVLSWLYSTAIIQLSRSKMNAHQISVVNLNEYIDLAQQQLTKLRHIEKEVFISQQTQTYNTSLKDHISLAVFEIKYRILPEIERNFYEIDRQLFVMMDELYERQDKYVNKTGDIPQDIADLLPDIVPPTPENPEPISAPTTTTITPAPIPNVIPTTMSKNIVAEWHNEKLAPFKMAFHFHKPFYTIYSSRTESDLNIERSIDHVSSNEVKIEKTVILCVKQLNDIESELNRYLFESPSKDGQIILHKITEVKNYLIEKGQNCDPDKLHKMRNYLGETMKAKQSLHETQDPELASELEVILAMLELGELPNNIYSQLSVDDIRNILNFNDKIEHMNLLARNETFNQTDEYIYDSFVEKYKELESTVHFLNRNLANESNLELDMSIWQLKYTVQDFKAFCRQLSNETKSYAILDRKIQKLDDALSTLVKVYENINNLKNANNWTSVVETISHDEFNLEDNELIDAILRLKQAIQRNVIQDVNLNVISKLTQHLFPFHGILFKHYRCPKSSKTTDFDTMFPSILELFNFIRDQNKHLNTVTTKYDSIIYKYVHIIGDNFPGPFYIWSDDELKGKIGSLLKGDEVEFRASSNMAPANMRRTSAMKFNEISIRFVATENGQQAKLMKELEKYVLKMSMASEAEYICNGKKQMLTTDQHLSIHQSFKLDANQQPILKNDVYRKISEIKPFLSPYVLWKVQLENIVDETTIDDSIANIIDRLELTGKGEFISDAIGGQLLSELCEDHIEMGNCLGNFIHQLK